jgi:hypothetical protein
MLHKMSILRQKVSSQPFPPSLPSTLPFPVVIKNMLWKLEDGYEMCPTNTVGETFPTPPLSLCCCDGKLDFGVDYEIRLGYRTYSQLPRAQGPIPNVYL